MIFSRIIPAFGAFFMILFKGTSSTPSAALPTPKSTIKLEASTPSTVHREHLRFLALLQQESRFIDFVQEDLTSCSDEEIGAVARQLQIGCKKVLDNYISIQPIVEQPEGSPLILAAGFNPLHYKLIGKLAPTPPYHGTVRHCGWKANKLSLPTVHAPIEDVLLPAEIEV